MDIFEVNEEFIDYNNLIEAKKRYEAATNTLLVVKDSRKAKGTAEFIEKYKYDRILYVCKAGLERPSESKGMRIASTIKKNCLVKVRLAIVNNKFVVKDAHLTHDGHALDPVTYAHYPENLRLSNDEIKEAQQMIRVGGNKKKIKMQLMQKTGKPIQLKTLHNLQTKMSLEQQCKPVDTLDSLHAMLSKIPNSVVEFVANQDNELLGIYYQDSRMARIFEKYPELILFDATYKLNNMQMPLFVQMCIDGNGQSELISLYVCRSESREGVEPMLKIFQKYNPNWRQTKIVIGDKDFADRSLYADLFPDVVLQICLYHVMATFNREVTTKKRDITTVQRTRALLVLQKLVYSRSPESYEILYKELCDLKLDKVTSYYNENWHLIKEQWTTHGRNTHAHYLNVTNNRTERLNRTLKQIGSRYSGLLTFFENLTTSVTVLASEKDIKVVKSTMKVVRRRFEHASLESYNKLLTSFVFEKVESQFEDAADVKFVSFNSNEATARGGHKVSCRSCTCEFFSVMNLICKHIFKFLEIKNLELYDPSLCAKRWTKSYYEESHPALDYVEKVDVRHSISFTRIRCPDEKDKYKKAATVTKEINNLACTMSESKHKFYLEKLAALRNEMLGQSDDDNLEEHPEYRRNATQSVQPSCSRVVVDVHVAGGSVVPTQLPNKNYGVVVFDEITVASPNEFTVTPTNEITVTPPIEIAVTPTNEITVASQNEVVEGNYSNKIVAANYPNEIVEANSPNEIVESGESTSVVPSTQKLRILLPNKIKQIGRPKGSGLTVIGTKRKAKTNEKTRKFDGDGGGTIAATVSDGPGESKKRKFVKVLDPNEIVTTVADSPGKSKKRRVDVETVKKFVDQSSKVQGTLIVKWLTNFSSEEIQNKKIEMWQIIQDPNMFNRLRNEVVQIQCVRKFFDHKTYQYLCEEVENLKGRNWACTKCKKILSKESVQCLCCLDKYHQNCVVMVNDFCQNCIEQ